MSHAPEAVTRDPQRGVITTAVSIGLVIYVTALRLYFGAHVDLMPEETYYWNYSRHLALGYLDHPPMVAWLIRAGTALLGHTALGVRIGAVLCGLVTSVFVYRLTRNLYGRSSAALALALAQAMPFFFVQGLLMTPDTPLTTAWAASLYFLERALIGGNGRAWLWAGLCLGLGMLSKYTIGLLGLGALVYLVIDADVRPWLRRFEPYAAAALAFAIFSPVIVWNAEHHWASFAFQTARRLAGRPRFALPALIGAAIVLITPTGFAAAVRAIAPRRSGAPADAKQRAARRFLLCVLLVPMSVFVLFSLRRQVKLDWTGATWLAALPLIAFELVDAGRGGASVMRRMWRASMLPTIGVLCVAYPIGLYHLAHGLPGLGYDRRIELLPVGWRQLGRRIDAVAERFRREHGTVPLVVGMDRYVIASELAFYGSARPDPVGNTTSGHLFGGMGLMYERWFPVDRQLGRTLLLVSLDRPSLEEAAVPAAAASLGPIRSGALTRNGHFIRDYYYRFAYDYRGPPAVR